MKNRFLFLMIAIIVICLVICSCSNQVNNNPSESKSTINSVDNVDGTTNIIETEIDNTVQSDVFSESETDQIETSFTEVGTGGQIEIQLFEITITYVFSDGTKAAPSRKAVYEAGTVLDVESPEIEGYEPNLKRIYWSSISSEKTFRVVYSPIDGEETKG